MRSWLLQYAVAAAVFCVLDGIWLAVVAQRLYEDRLGTLLAEEPVAGAAVAFYALFVAGLVFFVVDPALRAGSVRRAALAGGFFGLVTEGVSLDPVACCASPRTHAGRVVVT